MIRSMTGYGSAKGQAGDLQISVEVKSVNNRYLDASVRMPRSFLFAVLAVCIAVAPVFCGEYQAGTDHQCRFIRRG